jgi:hypothetical protein
MKTLAPGTHGGRVLPWRALALLLIATAVGTSESRGSATVPVTRAIEQVASANETVAPATAPIGSVTEPVASAAEPVVHSAEQLDGAGRLPKPNARPRIGRIFFTPAERRNRRGGDGSAATWAAMHDPPPAPSLSPARERLVVNGALSSSTHGSAVWVNGSAVENSAADKSAWTDRNGNVWVVDGGHGIRLVRPGQSIDRSGVIEDLLPSGAVTRR